MLDVRCPYCHDALASDDALACEACGAPHHPGCFAEHGGCSVHACPSRRAAHEAEPLASRSLHEQWAAGAAAGRAGDGPGWRVLLERLRGRHACPGCGDEAAGPLLARCTGCGALSHPDCLEAGGGCTRAACRALGLGHELLPAARARWRSRRQAARHLRFAGLFFLPLALYLLLVGSGPLVWALAAAASAPLTYAQLALWGLGREPVDDAPASPRAKPQQERRGEDERLKA